MTNKHGDFIWYELLTPDQDAARVFYESVIGWTIGGPAPGDDMDYRMISSASGPIAGAMTLSPEMQAGGMPPCWLGYVTVDDVDACAAHAITLGGKALMEPWEIPGVGRAALLADPQGAMFYIMKPIPPAGNPDAVSTSFAATEPMVGHCAWNELMTSDPVGAKAFYGALFGWQQEGGMDMGPLGQYEFWQASEGRFTLGALMSQMPGAEFTVWSHYFRVPDIDVAIAAITAGGGKILQGPDPIPGDEFSVNAMDPQGAAFSLVGARV